MIMFEFDEIKSQANLLKHGINFIDAQALWDDPSLLEITANTEDEPRYLMVGLILHIHWSAIITYRGSNVRLISVRRLRTEEVTLYESYMMKAKDFEQQFDDNVDITTSLDLTKAKRVLQEQRRVNVDFPTWMIESLDREASKLGVTRQSIIKVWLAERLERA